MFDSLAKIQIPPEVYALTVVIGFMWWFHLKIKASTDLQARFDRLLATMISKKMVAWFVITCMFIYDHFVWQYDGLRFFEYLMFTVAVFGISSWEKKQGLGGSDAKRDY